MISALHYRPKITSIVFADNYGNFSTRSQLHLWYSWANPLMHANERTCSSRLWANPRSLFALTSKPAARAYERVRARHLRLPAKCARRALRADQQTYQGRYSSSSANRPSAPPPVCTAGLPSSGLVWSVSGFLVFKIFLGFHKLILNHLNFLIISSLFN